MTPGACTSDAPPRPIAAGRLRLEPLSTAHAPAMFALLSDPRLYEHEGEPPWSLDGLAERYRLLETGTRGPQGERALHWAIRLDGDALIGGVQATVRDGQAAIAYELGSAWWGQGHASAAVRAMLDELASRHGVQRCTAVLKQENLRSLHLLRRLRFTRAMAAEEAAHGIERDEWLMQRLLQR